MPTLIFNSGTGNDGNASGSQGAIAAAGTAASFAGNVVSLDGGPDLSGFDADADVLWLNTTSGRQFFDLSAADNTGKTVTTVDAPAGTASGLSWGIGGKRATWDSATSRNVFSDLKSTWVIETETAQAISSAIQVNSPVAHFGDVFDNYPRIQGSSSGRQNVTQSANAACFQNSGGSDAVFVLSGLKLENTNGTKTASNGVIASSSNYTYAIDCELGDVTNQLQHGYARTGGAPKFFIRDSYVHHCTGSGVFEVSANATTFATNNIFADNGSYGIDTETQILTARSNVFARNALGGLRTRGSSASVTWSVEDNTFDANGSGLLITLNRISSPMSIFNNIFSNHTQFGIDSSVAAGSESITGVLQNNAYFNNTSGDTNLNGGVGDGAITGVDPQYTDANNNDFSIGDTALAGAGYPKNIGLAGTTTSYKDIGVAQRESTGGGPSGGLLVTTGMTGGIRG